MDTDPFIRRAVQQAADNRLVLNALQAALRTLQQHSGITCHAEREVFRLDFEPEIRLVSSAVELVKSGVVSVPPPRGLEKTIDLDEDEQPSDEARVLHALHVARYVLSIHSGMGCVFDGEEHILNFRLQTDLLTDAMEMMGVDMSKLLHAPMPRGDPHEDDDDDA
ncbi:conserved hypothetical protein [Paraburkholderia piptadeniae]|uniref:Uncharacterized protein n=1 Tax=Paraburkholderia piptadeniae TaxID=1701573 RepID=A0A1N7SUB6_9BURK|nr:conserved hypothetical protein [Paraburkholderia piptadeniae]